MTSEFCEGYITCNNIIHVLLGDVVKYFLCVYQPDASEEFNMSQASDLGNSSIDCKAEQTKDGGWHCKSKNFMHLMLNIGCFLGLPRLSAAFDKLTFSYNSSLPIYTSNSFEWKVIL